MVKLARGPGFTVTLGCEPDKSVVDVPVQEVVQVYGPVVDGAVAEKLIKT
jgi:hypothetical protein